MYYTECVSVLGAVFFPPSVSNWFLFCRVYFVIVPDLYVFVDLPIKNRYSDISALLRFTPSPTSRHNIVTMVVIEVKFVSTFVDWGDQSLVPNIGE